MYIPKQFLETDTSEISRFITNNSFATLISFGDGVPIATHLPLELETSETGQKVISGHISRGNKQRKSLGDGSELLALFTGPHSYISSSWYNQVNVPTWNYVAIHIYGKASIVEGDALRTMLTRLMSKYESPSLRPAKFSDLPEDFLRTELKGIVGFEMSIDRTEAAYKLSQNRDDRDYQAIIAELKKIETTNALDIAQEMEKRRKL